MRLDPDEARRRILDLLDDANDTYIPAIVNAGQNEQAWYYIVVMERDHEGNTYLNERYAQLVKPKSDFDDDTFLKNGINRRVNQSPGVLASALRHAYERAFKVDTDQADPDPWEPPIYDGGGDWEQ